MTVLSNIITPSNVLTTTNTATVTNKTFGDNPTFSAGTANGVTYLNGSKVLTSGSSFTYGTGLTVNGITQAYQTALYTVDGTLSNYSATNGVYLAGNAAGWLNLAGDGTNASFIRIYGASYATPNIIQFNTASSEKMRLDASGNLGIGTSSPSQKLQIQDAGNLALQITKTGVASFSITNNGAAGTVLNVESVPMIFNTANTERARIDSSGNLTLATTTNSGARFKSNYTTSAATGFNAVLSNMASSAVGNGAALIFNNSSSFSDSGFQYNSARIQSIQTALSGELSALTFSTYTGSNCSEKARIDSVGSFFVDCTETPNGSTRRGFAVVADTGLSDTTKIQIATTTTSSRALAEFNNGNGNVGSISVSGSATAYNTSSDYRLKNTISPMTGALAKVALLKPVTYKWNADGSDGEGFIAHELAEVCPQAVTGDKDAIDAEGNSKYQGIDVSFLVATLTAAIQEQQAIIESLKARLDAANL